MKVGWLSVGLLVFFFERREGRRRGAGLCNQYFLCDNSYLVFSQEGVHRNALAQLVTTFTEDFSSAFHQ